LGNADAEDSVREDRLKIELDFGEEGERASEPTSRWAMLWPLSSIMSML